MFDAELEDYELAPAFLMGIDLRASCTEEEVHVVRAFLDSMKEDSPPWIAFVQARGFGDHVEDDARKQLESFRKGFDLN